MIAGSAARPPRALRKPKPPAVFRPHEGLRLHDGFLRSNRHPSPRKRGEVESAAAGRFRSTLVLRRPLTLASLALRLRRKALSPHGGERHVVTPRAGAARKAGCRRS